VPDREDTIIAALAAPWPADAAAISLRVEAAAAARGDAETDLDLDLDETGPDDAVRWAPGAQDSLFGAPDASASEAPARTIAAALSNAARQPSAETFAHLYARLEGAEAVSLVDQVLPRVAEESAAYRGLIAALARRILREAPHVEPVKFSIALLGVFGAPDDEAAILAIGAHDEFTLFSAVALSNLSPDAESAIWRLAQSVHGWGRIQAVERLRHTTKPAIKDWLLRRGWKNSVMVEYLAHLCATTGGLKAALEAPRVDPDLLAGASALIDALIAGGPAEDIADYADGPGVLRAYLDHVARSPACDLQRLLVCKRIQDLVSGDARIAHWPAQAKWTLRTKAAAELARPEWRTLAETRLRSEEEGAFNLAADAIEALGGDAWPARFEKQRTGGANQWWALTQTEDADRMAAIIALALETLDLEAIAGPAMRILPAGAESALDWILQALRRFPGMGWPLIAAGFRGQAIRVRNMAIFALNAWPRDAWPPDAMRLLREAEMREPDAAARRRFAALRAGVLDES
jgi:hypothetical protein